MKWNIFWKIKARFETTNQWPYYGYQKLSPKKPSASPMALPSSCALDLYAHGTCHDGLNHTIKTNSKSVNQHKSRSLSPIASDILFIHPFFHIIWLMHWHSCWIINKSPGWVEQNELNNWLNWPNWPNHFSRLKWLCQSACQRNPGAPTLNRRPRLATWMVAH